MLRTCTHPPLASLSPSKCILLHLFLAYNLPETFSHRSPFPFPPRIARAHWLISSSLPEPKDDVALEAAIYREFLKYGKCWVKIRRDSHHMPFAFVQFTSDEEALDALDKGKGAMIFGRPCRTEMVKANRTFIMQKKNGAQITIDEAEKALLPFGSMSKIEVMHPQLREPLRLPPTVLVEFSMFDATRDLHQVSLAPLFTALVSCLDSIFFHFLLSSIAFMF